MMLTEPQTARTLLVHTESETTLAALKTSVQTWLDGRTEEVVVGIEVRDDGTNYYAFILYTE